MLQQKKGNKRRVCYVGWQFEHLNPDNQQIQLLALFSREASCCRWWQNQIWCQSLCIQAFRERGIELNGGTVSYCLRRTGSDNALLEKPCYLTQKHSAVSCCLPQPGCVNTTEMDIRKCRREKNPHRVKKVSRGSREGGSPTSMLLSFIGVVFPPSSHTELRPG